MENVLAMLDALTLDTRHTTEKERKKQGGLTKYFP